MNFKQLKKFLNKHDIKYINPRLDLQFSNVDYFLITKKEDKYFVDFNFFDKTISSHSLNKEILKQMDVLSHRTFIYVLDKELQLKTKPEEVMKLTFYNELKVNYPNGSILCEYTHMELDSRADFVVFHNGDCHVFELKTASDNLSRLPDQLKSYKTYASKVFVVLDEKHLKNYNSKDFEANLIVHSKGTYNLLRFDLENKIEDNLFNLVWIKEKDTLFNGLKDHGKFSLEQKEVFLKRFFDINKITFKILEERYRSISDHCRLNHLDLFKRRDFTPANIRLKELLKEEGILQAWEEFKK